jgi:hypothetical protein
MLKALVVVRVSASEIWGFCWLLGSEFYFYFYFLFYFLVQINRASIARKAEIQHHIHGSHEGQEKKQKKKKTQNTPAI